jgi:hypothetical protein
MDARVENLERQHVISMVLQQLLPGSLFED